MINKNKSPNQIIIYNGKCVECNQVIMGDRKVPNYGGMGFQKICRPCRNRKSLRLGRKRAQIIKDNPLW